MAPLTHFYTKPQTWDGLEVRLLMFWLARRKNVRLALKIFSKRKIGLVEETYLLEVCQRIKMDLLEKILSGKDPEKEKSGCTDMLPKDGFLTGKLKDFLSSPKNCRTILEKELVRNWNYIPRTISNYSTFLKDTTTPQFPQRKWMSCRGN